MFKRLINNISFNISFCKKFTKKPFHISKSFNLKKIETTTKHDIYFLHYEKVCFPKSKLQMIKRLINNVSFYKKFAKNPFCTMY